MYKYLNAYSSFLEFAGIENRCATSVYAVVGVLHALNSQPVWLDDVMVVGPNEVSVIDPVDRRRWPRLHMTLDQKVLAADWILVQRRVHPCDGNCC